MTFDWDETKRLLNLQKHGIGFLDAQVLFHDERAYTYRSPRPGEAGGVTVGSVEARLIALVWTPRGDAVRLIPARRARREEKKRYRELFG